MSYADIFEAVQKGTVDDGHAKVADTIFGNKGENYGHSIRNLQRYVK